MKNKYFIVFMLIILVGCKVKTLTISQKQQEFLHKYIKNNAKTPNDYIIEKFKKHDVVILGEHHAIRENCQFVSGLIEKLYNAKVFILATEFLRSKDTKRMNQLLTAKQYNQEKVIQIFRKLPQIIWGYQEYMDICHAIWKLNRKLPKTAKKFRIIGLEYNWNQYKYFKMGIKKRFHIRLEREKHMTNVLRKQVLDKNLKGLVHIGFLHSITCQKTRFGGALYQKYSNRIFQTCLHYRNFGKLYALLEKLFATNDNKPIGIDIKGSPLGKLRDSNAFCFKILKNSSLSDFAHGYVFLKPFKKLRKVNWIKDFINKENFLQARYIMLKMKVIKANECKTIKELNKKMSNL